MDLIVAYIDPGSGSLVIQALIAGLVGEFDLSYAFLMGAAMALVSAAICLFLPLKAGDLENAHSAVSPVTTPADP